MTDIASRSGSLLFALGCGGLALGCGADPIEATPSADGGFTSGASTGADAGGPDGGAAGNGTGAGEGGGGGGSTGDGPSFPPPGPPGGDACPELTCLPCGNGRACAEDGPFLGDSCCAPGDALLHRGQGSAAEAVDVEVLGNLSFLCGGFGARINDVSDPEDPVLVSRASPRCQRVAVGPTLEGDRQVFWLAHHGDTWVENPFLGGYVYDPASDEFSATEIQLIEDPDILFEGIVYRDGHLYVATHAGGLRTYTVDAEYQLSLASITDGFDNATKIAVGQGVLYVADQGGGVKVVGLADPANPTVLGTLPTTAVARDVAVRGNHLAVSMGGGGVDLFTIGDPLDPSAARARAHLAVAGTAQAVDLGDDIIAVAAWTHVAIYDLETLQLLATERVRRTPEFEQDLGIALDGNRVHVAEWEGLHVLDYRPGLIAPDLAVDQDIVEFNADAPDSRVVVVRNRGYLDLDIDDIGLGVDGPYTIDTAYVRVPPQRAAAFEVSYEPDGFNAFATLALQSNDPDEQQSPHQVPLSAISTDLLDVGDTLTEEFGFLDPTGTGSVEGLRGHVTVLAYFALF